MCTINVVNAVIDFMSLQFLLLLIFWMCVWDWSGAWFVFAHRMILGVFCRKRRCVGILPYSTTCWSLCRGSLATSSCSKTICTACQRTQTTSKTLRVSAEQRLISSTDHSGPLSVSWKYCIEKIHARLTGQDKRQNVRMTLCEYQVLYPLQNRWSWSPQRQNTQTLPSGKWWVQFQMNTHTPSALKTSTAT